MNKKQYYKWWSTIENRAISSLGNAFDNVMKYQGKNGYDARYWHRVSKEVWDRLHKNEKLPKYVYHAVYKIESLYYSRIQYATTMAYIIDDQPLAVSRGIPTIPHYETVLTPEELYRRTKDGYQYLFVFRETGGVFIDSRWENSN